jgi:hypothetical protein
MAMTRQEREVFWREVLNRQAASGLSVRAWCAGEGVAYASFLYWRRRLARPDRAVPLTLIRVTEGDDGGDGLWLSVGGARIEVKPGFDEGLLRRVVAALGA